MYYEMEIGEAEALRQEPPDPEFFDEITKDARGSTWAPWDFDMDAEWIVWDSLRSLKGLERIAELAQDRHVQHREFFVSVLYVAVGEILATEQPSDSAIKCVRAIADRNSESDLKDLNAWAMRVTKALGEAHFDRRSWQKFS